MNLVNHIRRAKSDGIILSDREFLGRWERLTESGCNPHPELELLAERLKRPPPGGGRQNRTVSRSTSARAEAADHFENFRSNSSSLPSKRHVCRGGSLRVQLELSAFLKLPIWLKDTGPQLRESFPQSWKRLLEDPFVETQSQSFRGILAMHRTLEGSWPRMLFFRFGDQGG